jgi:uncharacterized protein YndB with AHSA1/START domain
MASDDSVRKTIVVAAPAALAFEVFTARLDSWWPLESHHIGKSKPVGAVIEPRAGGRWYERGEDGSECDWGRVLAFEPPRRLLLTWEITADWQHDPTFVTEVEVKFIAEGDKHTRVELEHRLLDRYGARAAEMRAAFDSPGGWTGLLDKFASAIR